jgi:serine/threonine-protein kinase
MGDVYEAIDTSSNRRVAVKVLRMYAILSASGGDAAAFMQQLHRFRREAHAVGAIASPHIVEVLDAGQDPETHEPFIVLEYLEGEDVHELLRRRTVLPVHLALKIAAQACAGLSAVHAAKIVHRDIKPANLYLRRNDHGGRTVKIIDFGVARMTARQDGNPTRDLTRTGAVLGSPKYMSPEQARGLRDIDARADVWSLGVALYKMLSGRMPHEGDASGLGALLLAICTRPAPLVRNHAPWIRPAVAEIVHRALQIERAHRYPNVEAMREAIEAQLPTGSGIDEAMLASSESARVDATSSESERKKRQKRMAMVAVPAAVVCLLATGSAARGSASGSLPPSPRTRLSLVPPPSSLTPPPMPPEVRSPVGGPIAREVARCFAEAPTIEADGAGPTVRVPARSTTMPIPAPKRERRTIEG